MKISKYYSLNGKIEIYDIEKFKDWLFKELQEQEFIGVFDIDIDEGGRDRGHNLLFMCNKKEDENVEEV